MADPSAKRVVQARGACQSACPSVKPRTRIAIGVAAFGIGLLLALPGAVPAVVDGVRSVVGPAPIAWLEDRVYGVRDMVVQRARANEAPAPLFAPTVAESQPIPALVADTGTADAGAPCDFPPPRFAPVAAKFAGARDGEWIAIADDVRPAAPPAMYKAGVHPDVTRPYAVVAVVAMYMPDLALHLVAGTREPESDAVSHDKRPGRVPAADAPALLAAFNGGWQAIHGHFGMMVDGNQFLPPRDRGCTIGIYKDGHVAMATWTKLITLAPQAELAAYRQGPRCLVETGANAGGLKDEALGWGASVDGETVIRRSALGISDDGRVLYYGMGDDLTARTVADALARAGARTVMELDINASFPRFLLYGHVDGPETAKVREALIPSKFGPQEYVGKPWYRDFFYVTRKPVSAP